MYLSIMIGTEFISYLDNAFFVLPSKSIPTKYSTIPPPDFRTP